MNTFNLGVRWGIFMASMSEDDADYARIAAIDSLIDAIQTHGVDDSSMWVIDALTSGFDEFRCHGYLASGAICGKCGTTRGE